MTAIFQTARMIATAVATFTFGLVGLTGLVYILHILWGHSALFSRLPPAEQLDEWMGRGLAFGMPWLTLGMVSAIGQGWLSTGLVWTGDPQTSFLLVLWLYYAALLSGRLTLDWDGAGPALLTLVGAAGVGVVLAFSI